ncbi:M16 family metallopeptidase [Brevundimonas subvibrioides]|uniref:M16 family metallopeptidase n=1 Tax=Brevundimonas subvibrioides TaxID=74313 RepID=UPI0022B3A081|nr:pitrilysin family protein [Brevundimonas subvibrioides]
MRLRLVSLAAIMAVIAPAVPAVAAGSEGSATASAVAGSVQAAPLQAAPVAELVSEVDIPWTRFTLDNGLTVIVHEDHKAPVVAVSVWYNVGSKDEPAGSTGFAHLFEHLMFGGSENAPGSYLGRMRNLGPSNLNGTTWFDRTNYFQTVPTPALEQALFLESDRMGYLLGEVGQEVLDLQRGVVQNEKRQGDNQPYGLFEYAQLEALFPEGHPYRHSTIGSMADLDAASLETVRNWFRENYGPNNAIVVLSGDITEATARPLMEKYFGAIPRGPVNTPAEADVPTLAAPIVEVMHDRVANTRLTRSWAVPGLLSDDAVPLSVGAQVLGGLASSRLDNLLVRQEQTAVAVSSSLSDFHRIGIFDISVDVKPGQDATEVSRRLDAIVADFIAQGPTEEEVARVATRYVSQRIQSLEQVNGKANVLAEGQLYAGDPDDYKKELAEYASVTPAQVTAAMQRWLTRPVFDMTIAPGEREAYEEAAAPSDATPVPAAELQRVARDPMPAIGQVPDLEFPAVERATLSNGVKVVYARVDTVPVTRVAVEFDAGYAADPADRLGAQAMMLDLLDEGTTTRSSNQLAEEEERLGASINVGASMDRTSADLSVVTANLTPSLTLLADVVRNPAFTASEIERIRASRLAGLASEKTNPNAIAARALPPLIYGETSPYGRSFTGTGDVATITALTRADLVATHAAWVRPDNATLFVVSDLPLSQVTPQLEAAFGDWRAPSTPRGTKAFADAAVPTPTNRIVLIDRPQSPQSLIYGGAVLPVSGTDDLLALNAANVTLGSDFLSRINFDLRETKGWSYGVRGSVNALEHRVPYIVNAPVQANRTGESIAALIAQYDRFLETEGVQPNELERTINGNTRSLAGGFETSAQILGALRSNALYGRPDDYQATLASRTRALTAARMDEAARAVIQPDHFVWVVVGDASVVRPQLDSLGLPVEVRSIE